MCTQCKTSKTDSIGKGEFVGGLDVDPIVIPTGGTPIVIGYHSSINGKESLPLQGVEPTLAEIKEIIRYHTQMLRAVDECWANGQSGSWEIRQYPYSNSRISYYAQFVDESEIQEIFDDVYKDFKESVADDFPDEFHDKGANAHFNE